MDSALLAGLVMSVAFGLSIALVPPVRVLARRWGVMDEPGERKVHAVAMPRLGGLGVFAAFNAVVVAGFALAPRLAELPWVRTHFEGIVTQLQEAHRVEAKLLAVVSGAAVAFGVGLLDDILGTRFPVWAKALGQVLATLLLIAAGVQTSFMPYEWMNAVVTFLWVVGMTNAFNLLDNMDGLAAGVACVASGVLLLNAWALGEVFISLILVAFIGSLLGFLVFNFQPASIFLGDCGSLFIGYLMGSLTLLERYVSHASSGFFPVLMPVLVLAVPLMDTVTVVVIRLRERRPIYVGDSRHLSHRLVSLGFSQRAAVLFLYLVTFCFGLGAASLTDATPLQAYMILLQSVGFVALLFVLLFFERRRKPRGPAR
jgi:UDP-GlcNAc:undecaprenyl-phosphate GlcNAc-1-phosphate transferase